MPTATPAEAPTPPEPRCEELQEKDYLAVMLTATPSLRAQFFANPVRAIAKFLPPPRYWDYEDPLPSDMSPAEAEALRRRRRRAYWWPWNWYRPFRYRRRRQELVKEVFEFVACEVYSKKLSASINTDSVFDEYFAPVARVSQRSYTAVYILSWAAFVIGAALIGVGTYVGIHPPKGVDSTIVASIFGGSGAVSALGSVLGMAISGIQSATADLARLRIALTAFATQLGQLRAVYDVSETAMKKSSLDVSDLNTEIGAAMRAAIAAIDRSSESAGAATASSDNGAASTPTPSPPPAAAQPAAG